MVMKSPQQGAVSRYLRALIERCYLSLKAPLGVDPHPQSHTATALDKQGKVLGHCTVANTAEGLAGLTHWLKGYEIERCAVEGANNPFARKLSQSLLEQGHQVVDVSPSLTSQYRELGPTGRALPVLE